MMTVTTAPPLLAAEFESLPPGDRGYETLDAELTAAIAAEIKAPRAIMFHNRLLMPGADVLAALEHYTRRAATPGYWRTMAAFHQRALDSAPALAELLRAPECLADVRAAAASLAFGGEAQAAAAEEAIADYEKAIAQQLAGWRDAELAAAAKAFLELLALSDRQAAARARHQAARQVAAEQAAAEARAAQEAADRAADDLEADRLLTEALQRHGLPGDLRKGVFVDAQRERLQLLAVARRRLNTTRSDVVRIGFGSERKVYSPRSLAGAIADASPDELQAIIRAVDIVEQGGFS